ncbi:MAG: response regulator [Ardenticatenaceae bacterium]|nr:response regulator [Anaerolineales bacterium]MCB8923075.1 response regulator [Ardenticatenaceae bacterium]MCB8992060.1 response regulator [Ardenticatenaceae bacterium]
MAYRILAIDDHPETLDIVVTTLRGNGYDVVGSQSPVKGLSLAEKMEPDLVLVDMNMPEMDGKEVCRRLRAHPALGKIPIIMFTAEGEAYQKLAGFEAGADDYLIKPTEPVEMLARIESMLTSVGKPPEKADKVHETSVADDLNSEIVGHAPVPPLATVALPGQETLIVVMGARGGAGTTTTAINLAVSMAEAGISTTLVDMDMVQGHMALYLNQAMPEGGINTLADLPPQDIASFLPDVLIPYGENLRLLLTKPNLDDQRARLTAVQAVSLIEELLNPGACVIVDLGLGINEANRPFIDRADQVIVCLRPERVALSAAKVLLHQLKNIAFPHTTLSALIFNTGNPPGLPLDAMQNFLGSPLLGMVSVNIQQMARSTNKGIPLVKVAPDSEESDAFRQITHKLINV